MGTNFYFMSRSKQLIYRHFAEKNDYGIIDEEYAIVDEPYLGYQVHLNKLSVGWRPLFQRHKTIKTFKELEKFYLDNKNYVEIYDEYGEKYTWKQYFDRIYRHSQQGSEPYKWVYGKDPIFLDERPTLHIAICPEEEAEIYTPFNHKIYAEKEKQARRRFRVHERPFCDLTYWEDPDYSFDWMEGEFC